MTYFQIDPDSDFDFDFDPDNTLKLVPFKPDPFKILRVYLFKTAKLLPLRDMFVQNVLNLRVIFSTLLG